MRQRIVACVVAFSLVLACGPAPSDTLSPAERAPQPPDPPAAQSTPPGVLVGAGSGSASRSATPQPSGELRAEFERGLALAASDQHSEAVAALAGVATRDALGAPAVWLEIAELELRARRPREAATAAANGLVGASSRLLQQHLLQVRAQGLAAAGDSEAAFDAHRQILALATSSANLGEQLFRLAQASRDLGKPAEAIRALQTTLEDFPDASTTPHALQLIEDLGASTQLDAYVLGRARLAAFDFRNAVVAFDAYLRADPNGADVPSARLLRAIASLSPGNEINALRDLDEIAAAPNQESEIAARAYLEAAQAFEALAELPQAEARYKAVLARFPRLDAAAVAGFRLGLAHYSAGADMDALAAWDALLLRRGDLAADDVSRALYWRGKALARAGLEADARDSWRQAAAVRPAEFYSLRAQDVLGLLGGAAATSSGMGITEAEGRELSEWFAERRLDLASVSGAVGNDPALARARVAAGLGLLRQGSWESEELIQRYGDRADRLYWLAQQFADLGLPAGSTRLAQAAYAAANLESPTDAPPALGKAAFPRPYAGLVDDAAARYGLDPLLLDAVFLQASGFDASATHGPSAAAGLALMSPVQAEEAAHALGEVELRGQSPLQPEQGIERSAWYLADRLRRYGGRPEVALAAVSNGDRVVDGWLARVPTSDPDLFVERIESESSRMALQAVLATRLGYAATYPGTGSSPLAPRMPSPEPTPAWVKIARLVSDLPPTAPLPSTVGPGDDAQQAAFARGAVLLRDGDTNTAIELFLELSRSSSSSAEVANIAQHRLGAAFLAAGRPGEALAPLASARANEPSGSAAFLQARALSDLGRCAQAVPIFEQVVATASGVLVGHGQAALAGCLQQLGLHSAAVGQLERAARTPDLPRLQVFDFRERLALARVRSGDVAGARADYEALLRIARSPGYRAELSYYLGALADEPSASATHFRRALESAPTSRAAQAALDELTSLGDTAAGSLEAGEARFEQDRYREALQAYDTFLASNPTDGRAADATYARALAMVRLGQDRAGIAALEDIDRQFPGSAAGANGLFRAGRVRESLSDLDGAARAFAAVLSQPGGGGERALDAQFRLAFVQLRRGDMSAAADAWRDLATRASQADLRAQALFWLGKALRAAGDEAAARTAWTSAGQADPGGFYALRANDLLAGDTAAEPRARADQGTAIVERQLDAADVTARELHAWVAARGDVGAARARLEADPGVQRAEILLALGLRSEAAWELEDAAERIARDLPALALLAAWENERGLYNPQLRLTYTVAGNAGTSLRTGAPAIRKLAYPVPHPLALAHAGRELRIDPLLFAALMLQESALDQYVESPSQARGLSQMIASAAFDAARALGRYDFRLSDLFQPRTSITLGAYTFGRRLERYDGHIFPALAAYNASQYAVDGWLLAAGEADVDTFAEAIPFTETYPYVQTIYENYRQYLELYGPPASP